MARKKNTPETPSAKSKPEARPTSVNATLVKTTAPVEKKPAPAPVPAAKPVPAPAPVAKPVEKPVEKPAPAPVAKPAPAPAPVVHPAPTAKPMPVAKPAPVLVPVPVPVAKPASAPALPTAEALLQDIGRQLLQRTNGRLSSGAHVYNAQGVVILSHSVDFVRMCFETPDPDYRAMVAGAARVEVFDR